MLDNYQYIFTVRRLNPSTMAWSDGYPEAVIRANNSINYYRSELSDDVIQSCKSACVECWEPLNSLADKRHPRPLPSMPVGKDGKRLVTGLLDTDVDGKEQMEVLFSQTQSPHIPEGKEDSAKAYIGALVLKNGESDSEDDIDEYVHELASTDHDQ